MAKFEKVSKFAEVDINLPVRKTVASAGYDFEVAENVIIPSYHNLMKALKGVIPQNMIMENGEIAECGTHAELMKKGGFYSTLYNSQFS